MFGLQIEVSLIMKEIWRKFELIGEEKYSIENYMEMKIKFGSSLAQMTFVR
jgi:hypothetical protein